MYVGFVFFTVKVSDYSIFAYDAAWLYLLLLNETLSENLPYQDGRLLFQKARNRTFYGEENSSFNCRLLTTTNLIGFSQTQNADENCESSV